MNKKRIALILSALLVLTAVVGGTLAWLVDSTDPLTNVFTTSDVDITLEETKTDFQMIPGFTIDKDPKVTVLADSEKCYVFVKVEKSANFDSFMTYTIADGWTELTEGSGVYYRVVADTDENQVFSVLKDDQVTVLSTVTKEMMDAIEIGEASAPTLTFTAYATQYMKDNNTAFTAEQAWANVKPTSGN